MKAKHPDANITLERRSFVPGLKPEENEEAAKLALQWTGGNRTYAVPYGTEAGIFRGHGIPTVICGPGSIDSALVTVNDDGELTLNNGDAVLDTAAVVLNDNVAATKVAVVNRVKFFTVQSSCG